MFGEATDPENNSRTYFPCAPPFLYLTINIISPFYIFPIVLKPIKFPYNLVVLKHGRRLGLKGKYPHP